MVKKIEQATGQKIATGELPEELVIENDKKRGAVEEKQAVKNKAALPVPGEAFHEKKPKTRKPPITARAPRPRWTINASIRSWRLEVRDWRLGGIYS